MSTPLLVDGAAQSRKMSARFALCFRYAAGPQGQRPNYYSSKRKGVNILAKADVQKKETETFRPLGKGMLTCEGLRNTASLFDEQVDQLKRRPFFSCSDVSF